MFDFTWSPSINVNINISILPLIKTITRKHSPDDSDASASMQSFTNGKNCWFSDVFVIYINVYQSYSKIKIVSSKKACFIKSISVHPSIFHQWGIVRIGSFPIHLIRTLISFAQLTVWTTKARRATENHATSAILIFVFVVVLHNYFINYFLYRLIPYWHNRYFNQTTGQ